MNLAEELRHVWRLWSVRLAALAGVFAAAVATDPTILTGLVAHLPEGRLRTVAAALVGLVVFLAPTVARLWPQSLPEKKDPAQ